MLAPPGGRACRLDRVVQPRDHRPPLHPCPAAIQLLPEFALPVPRFRPSGFFALRTPLLPFACLEDWSRDLDAVASASDPERWARDCERAREHLRSILELPHVREAVFLGSPSLDESTPVWLDNPTANPGIEVALVKYVSRMASRCTPFGLFAGNCVGQVTGDTQLALKSREAATRHTRPDMGWLAEVIAGLVDDPEIRDALTFSTNSSLYEVAQTLRYAESRLTHGQRAYFLVDVEPHLHLQRALERARQGCRLREIAEAIVDDDVPLADARAFVDQLVDAQLLVPELGPVVTGPESLDHMIARLRDVRVAAPVLAQLLELRSHLATIDREGLGIDPARYRALATNSSSLSEADPSRFVQVDLTKAASAATIRPRLVDALLRGAQVLVDLFGPGIRDPLEDFRNAFEERYGESDVALTEVLDEEIGIGFQVAQGPGADPSPLLAGLPFPTLEQPERVGWGSRGRYLEWKLAEAVASGATELILDPRELSQFRDNNGRRLPESFHIHAALLDPDPTDEAAPRAFLDAVAGPSGARLLGRFCNGDPELRRHVEDHLHQEEALHPDARYFEIVHLPAGRTGNILARPLLRPLELAYLGTSGAAPEDVLHIDDLMVGVRANRVTLRSRSLGCEVIPRLTSAHNTSWRSLGIYRFLSALQSQGCVEGLAWTWGPLESQPRLPRVRLGPVILARARWNLHRKELDLMRTEQGHAAFAAAQALRSRRGIPRHVGVVEQDKVLPLDFENPLSVAAFLDEIRTSDQVVLHEAFPGARPDVVDAPEGRFTNEVLIPVVQLEPSTPPRTRTTTLTSPTLFGPGSEWLTFKVFSGPAEADRVLVDAIVPVCNAALERGTIDRWFFLRYADPRWHLRVRLHGRGGEFPGAIIPELYDAMQPWLGDRRVNRLQIDSYLRETFRYGGELGVQLCEDIFFHDSIATAGFLEDAEGDDGLDARWRFCLVAMDRLLDDLGFDLVAKRNLARGLAELYGEEFGLDTGLRSSLRDRYRNERSAIDEALEERGDAATSLGRGYTRLRERSQAIAAPAASLRTHASAGELTTGLDSIAASLLHMHANRVLRSANRAQEMIIYRFLEKAYASRLARARAKQKQP